MEIDIEKQKLISLFDNLKKNLNNEDASLKFYTNKFYVEIIKIINELNVPYNKYTIADIVNRNMFYQIKARLNSYVSKMKNINENIENFLNRCINKGFNELECTKKANEYYEEIVNLNNKIEYNDIFNKIKNLISNEVKVYNQQFMYQLDGIININETLLKTEITKLRLSNESLCKDISNIIIQLGKINNKNILEIDNQNELIKSFLIDRSIKIQNLNKIKITQKFCNEASEILKIISKETRNITNKQEFIENVSNIFSKELETTYNTFFNKINNNLIPLYVDEAAKIIKNEKSVNVSRNYKMIELINKFSSDNDLIDMDIVFANIENLLMTKYGLSRSHPKSNNISLTLNLEKAKLENYIQEVESNILFGILIELQAKVDKMFNHKVIRDE